MSTTVPTASVDVDQRPSIAIVELVAREAGTDPIELEPLYDVIDPEVIDSLTEADGFTSLEFSYHGYSITVDAAADGLEVDLEEEGFATDDVQNGIGSESSS